MRRAPSFTKNQGARDLADARRNAIEGRRIAELSALGDAAALARVSADGLRLAVRRGDLACVWDKQGRQFFDPDDVLAWARARGFILTRHNEEGPALASGGLPSLSGGVAALPRGSNHDAQERAETEPERNSFATRTRKEQVDAPASTP